MKKLFMKAFEWLRRKVTAIKTMNGERLTKKEVVVTDSLNAHPSALNSNGETLLVRAERYLWERYEFRYNVLAKCYEYREVSPTVRKRDSSGKINLPSSQPTLFRVGPKRGLFRHRGSLIVFIIV
jgi:hypothetical protein